VWGLIALVATGCQTASYLGQAVRGQYQLVTRQRPIRKLVADAQTPPALKEKLQQVERLRQFARQALALPTDGHYLRYADLHRRYVVWDVYAAPEFSLEPKGWWYPIVGRLTYRGYFSEAGAERYASQLRKKGFDVYVDGVEAYSTLGWFRDPVLNTFIQHPETELAETLFHELAHQRLFVGSDTDFDEAFATAVAEEGVRRWLAAADDAAARRHLQDGLQRKDQVMQLVTVCRQRLESLYKAPLPKADQPDDERLKVAATLKRQEKERILGKLREDYGRLRAQWDSVSGYDAWFARPLNNAKLNAAATYYHLVPAFHRLLAEHGGDLKEFYRATAALARLPRPERHRRLNQLLDQAASVP
jgi:predicted aminopeptidase